MDAESPLGGGGTEEALRDERKIVTALFADVVGSTEIGDLLEPEEFRLVIGEAVDRMVRVVERFGGHVREISGDGLLALFGAPTLHEDDAERGVRTGLEVAAAMDEYGREVQAAWGLDGFAVRVGICTGPVVLGTVGGHDASNYTAYGDAVNVAARLERAAEPGSVLVDADTRRLAGGAFEWSEGDSLELRGKQRAVRVFRVLGYRPDWDEKPEFEGLRTEVVGRSEELAHLGRAGQDLRRGIGRILFLTGEAGIGKSRLLEELRERLRARDGEAVTWLEGHAASYGEATPYWPFRDLLRRWLGVGLDEPDLRVRIRLRKEIGRLFPDRAMAVYPYLGSMLALALEPDARERLAELSPEALQYRTFEVFAELVARLATDRPVALALEDVHWADPTSIQLLEGLFTLCEQAPVLIAVTARLDPDHRSWELRAGATREFPHSTEVIELSVLGGESDRMLLHGLVGAGTLPPDLEETVLEAAEGNPFFLEELIRSFLDAGALMREGERWRFHHGVHLEVPRTVERVILARIDRLPETTRAVLIGASVLGRRFTLPLLEAVTRQDPSTLTEALHHLQRLDLVRLNRRFPDPEYQFKHALIQETAYRTLLRGDRIERHERAARFLEEEYSESQDEVLGLLAHHWHAAEAEEKAIHYLSRAGDQARLEYSLDEAIDHYRQLLPLLEKRGQRTEAALVLFKLGLALHMALRFAEADRVYQRAFDHWEDPEPWAGSVDRVLRFAGQPTQGPDPLLHNIGDIQLCMALYDRLVEAWPDRTIVPSLAERWTISSDGLRYTFRLREGLSWADGRPLTAHDFEFGVRRVLDPDEPGMSVAIYFVLDGAQEYYLRHHADWGRVGVEALDDRTLEFRLDAPAPYFMWVVNRPDGGPQPRHAYEDGMTAEEIALRVVGGAFRVTELEDDRIVLERRRDDPLPRPGNVARVEWLRNSKDIEDEYLRGELDVANSRFGSFPRLEEAVPEEGRVWPPAWCSFLVFDHAHPMTGQVDFRRALAHAIDREAVRELALPNWTVATGGLVPPPLQGHTPDIARAFDPARAVELLERSEVDPIPIEIASVIDLASFAVVENVVRGWREVLGLEVSVVEMTREEYLALGDASERAERFPISLGGWYPGYPDPEYYLRLLLHSDSHTNQGDFADPAYDALVERARQERSDRQRLQLFHEADRYAVADQVAVIPLWYASNLTFLKPRVKGWWEFGKTWPNFAHLVVEGS